MTVIRTLCGLCSIGCGVRAVRRNDDRTDVEGDRLHPANAGLLCAKGELLGRDRLVDGRLLRPHVNGRVASWDRAARRIGRLIADTTARHGPDSIAMLLPGDLATEDYYVANKFMKGFVGSANIDVAGIGGGVASVLRTAFGEDVVPAAREDVDTAETILVIGADTVTQHPVLMRRVIEAREARGATVIFVSATAGKEMEADLHVAVRAGTEGILVGGLVQACLDGRGADTVFLERQVAHPADFADQAGSGHDIWSVVRDCGIPASVFRRLAATVAATRRMLTILRPPDEPRGAAAITAAVVNLHLVTGQIGRSGAGPLLLPSVTNAMGAREAGCLPDRLSAHAGFSLEERARIARFWSARRMAEGAGLSGDALAAAIADGQIRFLWHVGQHDADHPLARLQERTAALRVSALAYSRDARADIMLPMVQMSERDGTMTAMDRLISRHRPLFPAPGEARPVWWAITRVAWSLGLADAFPFERPAEIYREHARLSGYAGDPDALFDLRRHAPMSNPAYEGMTPWRWGGRLFDQGRFPSADGKARLVRVID